MAIVFWLFVIKLFTMSLSYIAFGAVSLLSYNSIIKRSILSILEIKNELQREYQKE